MSTPNALPELPSLPDEIQHAIDNYFIFTPERVKELMQDYAIAAIAATTKPADSAAVQAESDRYKKHCPGIPRAGCNYISTCNQVCNKCGEVHYSNRLTTPKAPTAQPVAPGWQLVPVEPTQEMLDYADKTVPTVFSIGDEYKAMLSAAPSMPPKEGV